MLYDLMINLLLENPRSCIIANDRDYLVLVPIAAQTTVVDPRMKTQCTIRQGDVLRNIKENYPRATAEHVALSYLLSKTDNMKPSYDNYFASTLMVLSTCNNNNTLNDKVARLCHHESEKLHNVLRSFGWKQPQQLNHTGPTSPSTKSQLQQHLEERKEDQTLVRPGLSEKFGKGLCLFNNPRTYHFFVVFADDGEVELIKTRTSTAAKPKAVVRDEQRAARMKRINNLPDYRETFSTSSLLKSGETQLRPARDQLVSVSTTARKKPGRKSKEGEPERIQ
jgi:hypothetical protein